MSARIADSESFEKRGLRLTLSRQR